MHKIYVNTSIFHIYCHKIMYKSIIKNFKFVKIYAHTYRLYLAPSIRLDYHRAIRLVLFIINV